jgi:hypothetical protein
MTNWIENRFVRRERERELMAIKSVDQSNGEDRDLTSCRSDQTVKSKRSTSERAKSDREYDDCDDRHFG